MIDNHSIDNEFVPINGYEGLYSINRHGDVWSHNRFVTRYRNGKKQLIAAGGKFMKHNKSRDYLQVCLKKDGYSFCPMVHKLIAEAFIRNPDKKLCVNHKDGNILNNSLENLEWVTHAENSQHAWKTGLCKVTQKLRDHAKTLNPRFCHAFQRKRSLTNDQARTALMLIAVGDSYCSISRQLNVSDSVIRKIARGETYKDATQGL